MTTDNSEQVTAEATETLETEDASAPDKSYREVELEAQLAEL